jgi:hypothetical protein
MSLEVADQFLAEIGVVHRRLLSGGTPGCTHWRTGTSGSNDLDRKETAIVLIRHMR